jgi:tetratricopeptide (TPR) repeat protein
MRSFFRRRKKWLVFAGIVAMVLLTVLAERYRGLIALRRWQRQIRAAGERLTLAELVPPLPTGGAARVVSPFELQARFASFAGQPDYPGAMMYAQPGKARVVWKQNEYLEKITNSWESLERSLAPLRGQVEQLREDLSQWRVFVLLHYEDGFDMLLPHLGAVKGAAQTLSALVELDLHQGRLEAAHANLLLLLRLEELLANDRVVVSQMVRYAIMQVALSTVWEALQAEGWTEEQLAQLEAACAKPRFFGDMAASLRLERAAGDAFFARLRRDPREMGMIYKAGGGSPGMSTSGVAPVDELLAHLGAMSAALRDWLYVGLWHLAWSYHDQLFYDRAMQEGIAALEQVAQGKTTVAAVAQNRALAGAWDHAPSGYERARGLLVTVILCPRDRLATQSAFTETRREMTVAAIALKRYRLRTGLNAPSLAALVPDFLPALPRDCYDGQHLRYRSEPGNGFVLYSVGENGKDDGGDPGADNWSSRSWQAGRDLVWPQPATAAEVAAAEKKRK